MTISATAYMHGKLYPDQREAGQKMKRSFIVLAVAASLSSPSAAQERLHHAITTPDGKYLTIETGPEEAASIGSYAVRLYGQANPDFPTDDFLSGIVVSRDGSLISTGWHDITGDGTLDLVITSETAGSGNYRTAHAISLAGDTVVLIAFTASLMPEDDEIAVLIAQFGDEEPH